MPDRTLHLYRLVFLIIFLLFDPSQAQGYGEEEEETKTESPPLKEEWEEPPKQQQDPSNPPAEISGFRLPEASEVEVFPAVPNKQVSKRPAVSGKAAVVRCMNSLMMSCPMSLYRSYDGSCNNERNPTWGQVGRPYLRMLDPAYEDDAEMPRSTTKDGQPLPAPREISLAISPEGKTAVRPTAFTYMVVQWGQYLSHEITLKVQAKNSKNKAPNCCDEDKDDAVACSPMTIPVDDPLGKTGQTCMEFTRSKSGLNENCTFVPVEQEVGVTPFLDGSPIYGSSDAKAKSVRFSENKGKLSFSLSVGNDELPPLGRSTKATASCVSPPCFTSGDPRINQHPGIASMYVLLLREHNAIATGLAHLNPDWDEDTVYEETRRIVIAEIQHITYNEYLPSILGPSNIKKFGLNLLPAGYFKGYDPMTSPVVANAFAAAGFRFGHSQLNANFARYDQDYNRLEDMLLENSFFNMTLLKNVPNGAENILLGVITEKPQAVDTSFVKTVTEKLFYKGLDLLATNIQRGRDNGLPPYNDWREKCQLGRLKVFSEINPGKPWVWKELLRLYGNIDEIDLMVGALAEPVENDALVGPTFACIIGRQFLRLRRGDRFWYENSDSPYPFTPAQLREIRKTSIARLYCNNLSGLKLIQPLVMKSHILRNNQRVSCDSIPFINLDPWREFQK